MENKYSKEFMSFIDENGFKVQEIDNGNGTTRVNLVKTGSEPIFVGWYSTNDDADDYYRSEQELSTDVIRVICLDFNENSQEQTSDDDDDKDHKDRTRVVYEEGKSFGLKNGAVKRLIDLLGKTDDYIPLSYTTDEEVRKEIIAAYTDCDTSLPIMFLETQLSHKDILAFIGGYIAGKVNHVRNKANKKYQEKTGWVSKSYKLHKGIVDDFADACQKNGVSLSNKLEELMLDYILGSRDDTE